MYTTSHIFQVITLQANCIHLGCVDMYVFQSTSDVFCVPYGMCDVMCYVCMFELAGDEHFMVYKCYICGCGLGMTQNWIHVAHIYRHDSS